MAGSEKNPTVLVQVSLVEVSLEKLNKLGITRDKLIPNGLLDIIKTRQENPTKETKLFGGATTANGGFAMLKEDDQYFSTLKALVKDKAARIIDAPTLLTKSGQEVCCYSGGQIVPFSIKNGAPQDEFNKLSALAKELDKIGTNININPVFLDKQTVRLEVKGSFSELDEKHNTKVAGTTFPGIKTRHFSTTCDIKNGYVMVMSGLVRQRRIDNAQADGSKAGKNEKTDVKPAQAEEDVENIASLVLIKADIVEPNQMATKSRPGSLLQ